MTVIVARRGDCTPRRGQMTPALANSRSLKALESAQAFVGTD